ncbi:MAG: DUF1820 family protein [Pseudomonadota bacterium]|nr:DUF1820 family protein [Pseudomonadota bacterium]
MADSRRLYRIKFTDKVEKKTITLIAAKVTVSDFFGLIAIEQLVFANNNKQIVLPEEDSIRQRYAATKRLHVPYHNVISIEEFIEDTPKLHKMPVRLHKNKPTSPPTEPSSPSPPSDELTT